MNSDCNHKNPLLRSGVNQYERVLEALLPAHVSVDERDYADLILFAKNYASQLKYYNASNVVDGNWQALMSMDVSVTLASLIKLDVQGCFAYVKKIFDEIKDIDASDTAALQKHFKVLFDFGFSITGILNNYYKALPLEFSFRATLGSLIRSNLQDYYNRLKAYYDEAVVQSITDPSSTFTFGKPPVVITLSQNFNASTLDEVWIDGSLPAFTPTFNGATTALKIKNTSTHNLFTGIFDQYLKTLTRIVEQASKALDKTLSDFPEHTPHYGLFLTFIKLFRYSQQHVNEFTKRHLDLYYKEILRLKNRDAEPDKVHLTFELAKAVESHLIKKDTIFKAGKDVDGEEIYYALTEDVVINKGAIKDLKSIFVDRNVTNNTLQVFANPVANSDDGQGGKLASADKSWKPFGDNERTTATIGFVVASTYLYLTEGTRKITFSFYAPSGESIAFTSSDIANVFSLQLSGKKGWVDVPIDTTKVLVHSSKEYFTITVTLDGGEPPIVPYSTKLHQHNFNTTLPVARFTVNSALAAESIWDFSIEKIGIEVQVTGMKNLAIQNDTGNLSTSKPFDLFGSTPHIGSSFILGSKEILMKTLQPSGDVKVTVNLTWDNHTDLINKINDDTLHKVDVYHLEDSVWKRTQANRKLFQDSAPDYVFTPMPGMFTPLESYMPYFSVISGSGFSLELDDLGISDLEVGPVVDHRPMVLYIIRSTSKIEVNVPALDVEPDFSDNANYDATSAWGFLKIELNTDFGHDSYPQRLADAAKNATITSTQEGTETVTTIDMDEVDEPYTPKVKEITVDYTVATTIDFSTNDEGTCIHLTPFGSKDITSSTDRTLLPAISNEGELFIGIENFKNDQTLSILFQVAEGTADPLAEKQEMTWHYLAADNTWIPFKKENIVDATNDLTQSGIIKFSIGDDAATANTLMTDQLHWLRATVVEKTPSVCKLIAVIAQAGTAQFTDYKMSGNYFKNTLPANTISKLVISDAAIKKITQPYASFGGKTKENDDHFYVRVSERLRHKNRAVAMWDYERMVLEAYPQIYKIKCINHAQILEKTSGTKTIYVDNELKPGHVLVVPIPDLKNKNAYDPLRPYTSLGLMTEVRKYLYQYVSPHVNLDVRNPKFEEIQLEFKIKFVTEDNDFYNKQLKEELEQYMAPWAYDPQTDIEFGGKISKSVLIDFIEERPYVDYLSCVKMYQIVEGIKSADLDEAIATSARSVFVSVKANDSDNAHKISFITDKCDC
jgi:hypothetical protein